MAKKKDKLLYFALLLLYSVAYNNNLRGNQLLWFGSNAIVLIILVKRILINNHAKVRINFFIKWAITIFSFFCVSILWSPNRSFPNSMFSLALIFLIDILLATAINSQEELHMILFVNYLALLFSGLYVIMSIDRSLLGQVRISSTMENAWNSNDLSIKMCIGSAIATYFAYETRSKARFIFWGSFLFFAIIIMYSGSRTGFLLLMLIVLFNMLIRTSGIKRMGAIVGSIVFVIIIYFLVIYYEPFYQVMGRRLEVMIDGLFGGGTSEGSFNIRKNMIESGIQFFWQKPILGHGIDSFRTLYGMLGGMETYSHNNFIEMLVSGGVVGFIIYYSIYVYIFKAMWRTTFIEKDSFSMCLFVIIFTMLLVQVSTISYYKTETYTILLMGILYSSLKRRNASIMSGDK